MDGRIRIDVMAEMVKGAEFPAGRQVLVRTGMFTTGGGVRLRSGPHTQSAWIASGSGLVRSWSYGALFTCTGARDGPWVEVRPPGALLHGEGAQESGDMRVWYQW